MLSGLCEVFLFSLTGAALAIDPDSCFKIHLLSFMGLSICGEISGLWSSKEKGPFWMKHTDMCSGYSILLCCEIADFSPPPLPFNPRSSFVIWKTGCTFFLWVKTIKFLASLRGILPALHAPDFSYSYPHMVPIQSTPQHGVKVENSLLWNFLS